MDIGNNQHILIEKIAKILKQVLTQFEPTCTKRYFSQLKHINAFYIALELSYSITLLTVLCHFVVASSNRARLPYNILTRNIR